VTDEQVVVAITPYTLILDMLGLNLGRDIGYPEFIPGFTQFLRVNSWIVSRLGEDCSFQILSNSLFTYRRTIRHYTV
jgi:hypothetical protein